jgi:hypothetical protein
VLGAYAAANLLYALLWAWLSRLAVLVVLAVLLAACGE